MMFELVRPLLNKLSVTPPIRSWVGVCLYAGVITTGAVLTSLVLLRLLTGPSIQPWDYTRAFIIALVIAPPFGFFGGYHLLRNMRLSAELRDLVERDRLTNVATRDFFFEKLHSDQSSYGVSLMVDIDHFKGVNDTFGHLAGDHVISKVASILSDSVRESDIVCRFGGEEFVIFLQDADTERGEQIAERIRSRTEKSEMRTRAGAVKVTLSVGGSLKDQLESIEETIRRADEALYRAKADGRNCAHFDWELSKVA